MKNWQDIPGCMQNINGVEIPTFKCFEAIFSNVLQVAVGLSVFALFIMLIVGGFKFLTSGGDPKATAGAQQTMTFAIIGIVLMVLAFLIFRIIEAFTGVSVTKFVIPI